MMILGDLWSSLIQTAVNINQLDRSTIYTVAPLAVVYGKRSPQRGWIAFLNRQGHFKVKAPNGNIPPFFTPPPLPLVC